MKISGAGEYARTSQVSQKARFEAAFEKVRRELRSADAPKVSRSPRVGFAQKRRADRPILTLAR
jgi:hypothetical protein